MSFQIEVKGSVAKAIKKLPKADQKRVVAKIDSLAEDLPNPEITKLKGNNPFHRIRVGNYRIIYEIQEYKLVVLIVKVSHRKDVYRRLS